MESIQARLISRNVKKGTAEVVVVIGGLSVTRHLVRVVGDYGIGRNPDEAAIARLDAAEANEAKALRAYEAIIALAEIKINDLRGILYRMRKFGWEAADVPAGLWDMVGAILRKKAESIFAAIHENVADAAAEAAMAHATANKVRADVPRTREFVRVA